LGLKKARRRPTLFTVKKIWKFFPLFKRSKGPKTGRTGSIRKGKKERGLRRRKNACTRDNSTTTDPGQR